MRILVVEDERLLCDGIAEDLRLEKYTVDCCYDGPAACERLFVEPYDLVVLDLNLPGMDGLELLRHIRTEQPELRVLILSARSQLSDKVAGLDLGADDYLTKPFRVAELRARVAAHLRRQNRAPASRMVRGGIGFDLAAKTAMVGEQPLPFTRSEYAISEYLALHAGQTFSKEQIYEAVFGYDGTADDTAVTQHIKNIRAKLRTAGVAAPETVLKTIWGVGYQWKSET